MRRSGARFALALLLLAKISVVSAAAPATLTFTFWGTPEQAAVVYAMIDAFEAENADIHIDAVPIAADYAGHLLSQFAGGTGPDVGWVEITLFPEWAGQGILTDLTPYVRKSRVVAPALYFSRAWQAFTQGGALYAIPRDLSPLVTYYNTDLFDQVGLTYPTSAWTWVDLASWGRKISRDAEGDGRFEQYGVGGYPWESAIWQAGGDVFNNEEDPTAVLLNSLSAARGMEWLLDLQDRNILAPPTGFDMGKAWNEGRIGMRSDVGRWVVPDYRKNLPFEWDVVTVPTGPGGRFTLHGGTGYFISRTSPKKDAAWRFVEFMAGPYGQAIDMALGRSVPTIPHVARTSAFMQSVPPYNNLAFIESVAFARRVSLTPHSADVTRILSEALGPILRREVSIGAGLAYATARLTVLLEEMKG